MKLYDAMLRAQIILHDFYLFNDLLHGVQSGKSLRFKRWEFKKKND